MTNTKSHAKKELEILFETTPDTIIRDFEAEILAICEKFGQTGQSGGSAPYTATALSQAVKKLCLHETIAPLTGKDDEWTDISAMNNCEEIYQNNRDSRVFKDGWNGKAYFLDAIVFDGDIGGRFTGNGSVTHNGENISSRQYIKEFPFTPKTFYVDVIEQRWKDKEETTPDINGDWWTHIIKNPKQLDEVFEYYETFKSE